MTPRGTKGELGASPFPPIRDWQRATDTSVFWARWNEPECFPGPRVPEWIGVRAGGVGDLVTLLREKLADLRPRLERVADPRWLADRWVDGLDDPDAWWPTLLELAATAQGLGDEALRDRELARLAGVDDEYWSGAELVDIVRRWMRTPAAGR